MKTVVIGGGPAGMMAAISAARSGDKVTLLEKNSSLGKKLLITGKGRCNITSSLPIEDFIKNIPGNGKFLYSAFDNFSNNDIIEFLNNNGIKTKVERGNRVFPLSDNSQDVLNAFLKELKKLNVKIIINAKVEKIKTKENKVISVIYNETFEQKAEKIILSTGGKSYPVTGSTGDGYKLAKTLGHTITKIKPSLVPLEVHNQKLVFLMQGLSLKNVSIKIIDKTNNKILYEDFGEMLFTHFGISGPIVLSASSWILRYNNIEELLKNHSIKISIDLKPALTIQELDLRIRRDFEEIKNKQFKNSLDKLLPKKMIEPTLEILEINQEKQINEITKEEREKVVRLLKNFELEIKAFRPIEEAIVTAGGINIKEINPKTMESKIVKGLFFAGEIIDVDAYTGGFNLQIAYSTGFTAGRA